MLDPEVSIWTCCPFVPAEQKVLAIAKFHLARHVSTRHDTFDVSSTSRRACRSNGASRDERVELCCLTISTEPKCMGSTRRTCHVVSRRDAKSQVEFGLMTYRVYG